MKSSFHSKYNYTNYQYFIYNITIFAFLNIQCLFALFRLLLYQLLNSRTLCWLPLPVPGFAGGLFRGDCVEV